MCGVQVSRGARFAEVPARARVRQARRSQVLQVRQHPALAIVVPVVVRARHKVDARPHELLEVARVGAGKSATGLPGRVLKLVHEHLEVREAYVGAAKKVH